MPNTLPVSSRFLRISTLLACAHSPSCVARSITARASRASAAEEYWMTLDFFTNSSTESGEA